MEVTSPFTAIIFDMDGVLVDTAHFHFLSWQKLAIHLGFALDNIYREKLKGISRTDSLEIVLSAGNVTANEKEKDEYKFLKNKWFLDSLQGLDREIILPGVINFLDYLQTQNIKKAVGSASANANTIIKESALSEYFDIVIDANMVYKTKPYPEVFLNAARDLQKAECECIVFEDSNEGIEAAKRGGFKVVGVGQESVLTAADYVIKSFVGIDLENIIANL